MAINHLAVGRVHWTNIVSATQQDIELLHHNYPSIHPLHLEDVSSRIERPKIDDGDDYLFIVMHFPIWDEKIRLTRASEVDIFLNKGGIITIHDGVLKPLNRLWSQITNSEEDRQKLLGKGANHVLYTIIDQLVDGIFPMLRKIDWNMRDIEEEIFSRDTRAIIRDITLMRRDVIALRRIIRQQVSIVESLERHKRPMFEDELDEYFGDIVDHLHKARDIIDEDMEIITGLAEAADTLASHRINEVMRVLTVISVIMLPLTLISGIYGMNIKLPFEDHPIAFIFVVGLMILIATLMLVYFRKRNWI
jgi:magnesium transporter